MVAACRCGIAAVGSSRSGSRVNKITGVLFSAVTRQTTICLLCNVTYKTSFRHPYTQTLISSCLQTVWVVLVVQDIRNTCFGSYTTYSWPLETGRAMHTESKPLTLSFCSVMFGSPLASRV